MYNRIILLVMDSVGIGHAADAIKFGDEGSNTLGHIEAVAGPIRCPNLKLPIFQRLMSLLLVLMVVWLKRVPAKIRQVVIGR